VLCLISSRVHFTVTSSSKTYILRNTLPSALIEAMMFHDPETRNAAYGARDPDDDAKADDMRPDDTLVAWKLGDNVAAIGILHVILALILANGRSIPERAYQAVLFLTFLAHKPDRPYGGVFFQRNCVHSSRSFASSPVYRYLNSPTQHIKNRLHSTHSFHSS